MYYFFSVVKTYIQQQYISSSINKLNCTHEADLNRTLTFILFALSQTTRNQNSCKEYKVIQYPVGFTSSKLTIESLEQGVKYVQS